jgi:hypothetical protein
MATTGWGEYRVQTGHYELADTRNSGQVLIRDAAGRLLEPAALSVSPVDNLTGPPQYMQQPDFLLLKYEYTPEDTQISQASAPCCFAIRHKDYSVTGPMTLAQLQDFAPLDNDAEWKTIPLPSTDAYWIVLIGIPLAAASIIGLFLWRLPLSTPIHPWRHVLHCRSAFKDSATDNPRFGRILRSVAALAATTLGYAIVFPVLCYALVLLLVLPGWLNQQQTTGSDGPGTYSLVTGHFIITGDSERGTVRAMAPSGKPVEETLVDVARTQNSSIGPPQWIMLSDHLVLHYGNDRSDDDRTWYAIRYSDYTVTGPAVRQDIQSLIGQELNSVHLPRITMQPWLSPTATVALGGLLLMATLAVLYVRLTKSPRPSSSTVSP